MREKFDYLGKHVAIAMDKTGDKAVITIDGKEFKVHVHPVGKPEDNYIRLWMCHDAYFMSETPEGLARHIVKYWHQYV